MDCTQAQEAITAALDRQPVDAEYLATAKEHCRTCADCGAFVRAQLVVKQMPLPQPPADLADRVMASVRAEAAAVQAAAEATAAAAAASAVAAEPKPTLPAEPLATLRSPVRRRRPLGRVATAIALTGIAAVMFVAAVSLAVFGSSQMNGRNSSVKTSVYDSGGSAVAPQAPSEQVPGAASGAVAATEGTGGSYGATDNAGVAADAGSYISYNGYAYELSAQTSAVDQSKLTINGVTSTSLASGQSPSSRNVFVGSEPGTVYIVDDSNHVLTFKRVTRVFQATTYQLTSAPISAFGVWPTLPPQIPGPSNANGSPEFVAVGRDGTAGIYRLSMSSAASGIAVSPNTAQSDPARGNPGWTWWAPAK
jgi:predicted anti-sigma-YlaC factor YlaD